MAQQPVHVLIVDGDARRADALEALLRAEESVRFRVSRGRDVRGAVGAAGSRPDVVLADPVDLAGLAILLGAASPAPVIVLSERADDPLPLRALQHGADDQLPRDQLYPMPVVRAIRFALERGGARAALQESEQRYRQLFQRSHDAIVITDAAGVIVEVNPAAVRLFGLTESELTGRPFRTLFVDARDYARLTRELLTGDAPSETEVRLLDGVGGQRWCLLSTAARGSPAAGWQGIIHDITERKRTEMRLLHDALHDALTQLPNRILFADRLEQAGRRAERSGEDPFALLFVDLDHFKAVNDSLGHAAGDRILRRAGTLMRACVRGHDTVARLGGDEFVILLDGIDAPRDAITVADRVLDLLARPGDGDPGITASIGIAWPTGAARHPAALLVEADRAMYRAKTAGGARYVLAGPVRAGS